VQHEIFAVSEQDKAQELRGLIASEKSIFNHKKMTLFKPIAQHEKMLN
jgi:hypothetical protein